MNFSLSTNALLPDKVEDFVKGCLAYHIPFDVGISIDAIGGPHDKVRGIDGNFEKADILVRRLTALRESSGVDFNIVAGQTIHTLTVDHIRSVKAYADAHRIAYLPQLYDTTLYYGHNKAGIRQTATEVLEGTKRMKREMSWLLPNPHAETILEVFRNGKKKFDCFALRTFMVLRANGDIVPCLRMADKPIGNLLEKPIDEIWRFPAWPKDRVRLCDGCQNTWAMDWSMQCNFVPFVGTLWRALCRRIYRKIFQSKINRRTISFSGISVKRF